MKTLILSFVLLLLVVGALALLNTDVVDQLKTRINPSYAEIHNRRFSLTLAKTDKERVIGLSNTQRISQGEGMLFIFDKKGHFPFWMRNMKFPIDIIFIDTNTIVDIYENLKSASATADISQIPVFRPKKEANYVLEINAGLSKKYNFKVGDKVTIKTASK